jgi:hypothetical protein
MAADIDVTKLSRKEVLAIVDEYQTLSFRVELMRDGGMVVVSSDEFQRLYQLERACHAYLAWRKSGGKHVEREERGNDERR